MKICPGCGSTMDDNAVFCTRCGAKLTESSAENTGSTSNTPNRDTSAGSNTPNQNTSAGSNTPNQDTSAGSNTAYTSNAGAYTNSSYTASQTAYGGAPNYQGGPVYAPVDPYDHTAEFTQKDISDNKVIAMVVYLMGTMGIIIALLGANTSPYAAFHVRQALKFTVIHVLMGIITVLLCWTFIVPLAALIALLVLFVVKIICFFSICKGQAKEPPIIRSFGFLR